MTLGASRIAALFKGEIVVEEAPPALALEALFPEERAQIERAVGKRQAEYATARICARRALARMGHPPQPILNDDERCPRWPEGVIGSITHTQGYCAVVLAERGPPRALGIDAEVDAPVRESLYDRICAEAELSALASGSERGRLVRLVFSAKEAFYKAQYPLTRQFLGFHDAHVALDSSQERFVVTLLREAGEFARGATFEGRYLAERGLLFTALEISRR